MVTEGDARKNFGEIRHFLYQDEDKIMSGRSYHVYGPSGSGKTTQVELLIRELCKDKLVSFYVVQMYGFVQKLGGTPDITLYYLTGETEDIIVQPDSSDGPKCMFMDERDKLCYRDYVPLNCDSASYIPFQPRRGNADRIIRTMKTGIFKRTPNNHQSSRALTFIKIKLGEEEYYHICDFPGSEVLSENVSEATFLGQGQKMIDFSDLEEYPYDVPSYLKEVAQREPSRGTLQLKDSIKIDRLTGQIQEYTRQITAIENSGDTQLSTQKRLELSKQPTKLLADAKEQKKKELSKHHQLLKFESEFIKLLLDTFKGVFIQKKRKDVLHFERLTGRQSTTLVQSLLTEWFSENSLVMIFTALGNYDAGENLDTYKKNKYDYNQGSLLITYFKDVDARERPCVPKTEAIKYFGEANVRNPIASKMIDDSMAAEGGSKKKITRKKYVRRRRTRCNK